MALNQPTHQNFVAQHCLYAESKPSLSWTCVYGGEAQPQLSPSTQGPGVALVTPCGIGAFFV